MKHDLSCFDPHSKLRQWCLRSQQFCILLWVVLIDYFVFKVSSLLLVFKNKAKCHLHYRCSNKDAKSCMSYRKLYGCPRISWRHSESESGKSMTFEIAHYVFALLQYEERNEISPICLIVVPLIAHLLTLGVDPSI